MSEKDVSSPSQYDEVESIENYMLKRRLVILDSTVGSFSSMKVIRQLLFLDTISRKEITFYINSPGGEVTHGLALYDTMQHIRSDVKTVCFGMAASMAAVLLSAGTK
jgi:ATP-dependent Clp protease protease subunit